MRNEECPAEISGDFLPLNDQCILRGGVFNIAIYSSVRQLIMQATQCYCFINSKS